MGRDPKLDRQYFLFKTNKNTILNNIYILILLVFNSRKNLHETFSRKLFLLINTNMIIIY